MDLLSVGRRLGRLRFQRGTLRQVGKNGKRWQGEWYVYFWSGGREVRRRRKRILGPVRELTKTQAQAILDRLIAASSSSVRPESSPSTTLASAYVRYHASRTGQWSDNQRSTVESVWKNQIAPTWAATPLERLDRQALQEWLNSLAGEGASQSLLDKVRVYLSAILRLAQEDGICSTNVAERLATPKAKQGRRGPAILSRETVRDLIAKAETPRDRIILRLLLQAGMRPQEVFVLRVNDVDMNRARIRIDEVYARSKIRAEGKTDLSLGWVAIPRSLADEIADHANRNELGHADFLFESRRKGRPATSNAWLKGVLKPLASKVGVDSIDLRVLRRTNATQISREAGVKAAQAQLRHARPDMTLLHYIGEEPEELRRAIEALDSTLVRSQKSP